jgi:hypothetical protein
MMAVVQLDASSGVDSPEDAIVDLELIPAPRSAGPAEPPPRQRTPGRQQVYFLRHLARSGSQVEAAARTGVTPRTVQRWRSTNERFARRYDAVIERRLEMLEDRAMRRAFSIDRRSVFRRDQPFSVVERYNDTMLMRVLSRFDRVRERTPAPEKRFPEDLSKLTNAELAELNGVTVPPGMTPGDALMAAYHSLSQEILERVARLSPSKRQENEPTSGQ